MKMAVSMQVAYPINDDTNFDLDYYIKDHLAIIKENWSEHIQQMIVTKGTSGGRMFLPPIMQLPL
jgi:hypothetical protein